MSDIDALCGSQLSTPDIDMDRPILPLKVKELDLQKRWRQKKLESCLSYERGVVCNVVIDVDRIYADTPKVPDTPIFMAPRPLGADEDSVADLSILYTGIIPKIYCVWNVRHSMNFLTHL